MMDRFKMKLARELDLEEVLNRLRLLLFATLGTLSFDQSIYADRMSRMVINESSDFDEQSSAVDL